MNEETRAVADFLSTEGTYEPIFTFIQQAQSDEQAAHQIENYVIRQRKGPEELYQSFERAHKDFGTVEWIEIVHMFQTD